MSTNSKYAASNITTREFVEMSFDDWFQQFIPIINTGGKASGLSVALSDLQEDHCMFETYGDDRAKVINVLNNDEDMLHIWTLLEADGELFISSGFHYVNRMGYFITLEPAHIDKDYEINYDD